MEWVDRDERGDPTAEGYYRVMIAGDSESIDGHTIYEYGDYPTWAYWHIEDDTGYFTTEHDESEGIFAYFGPLIIPDYTQETN